MATIVKEPWLNCKRFGRWRRKKFIAIILFAFFLIVLVSCLASGKYSRKLHKNIHQLEDKFENLEKTYKNKVWAFQRDIEALKFERKSLSQTPSTNQSGNVTSPSETEKTLENLQQQLKKTQEEMKEQNEAMKSLLKMFESYKEETSKELSELKSMHTNDQQEIQRLQNALKQLEVQKHEDNVHQKTSENKVVNEEKESKNDPTLVQFQSKNASTPPLPAEMRPKSNPNILTRGAKAVKEYVSNLAYKLNPFRSSRDKTSNNKPVPQENKVPVAVEGTIKKSLESVKSEPSQAEKNFAWLKNHIEVTVESVVSLLDHAASLDNPIEILKKIESKFNHLEKTVVDNGSTKLLNGKDQERVLKWKKGFLPIKEQFEKILHDYMTHGSKSHKHSSKNLQKLANTTRHLKDTL